MHNASSVWHTRSALPSSTAKVPNMPDSSEEPAADVTQSPAPQDKELAAIQALLHALTGLEPEARQRVVDYVFQRLGLTAPVVDTDGDTPAVRVGNVPPARPENPRVQDIRSFKEQKQPRSANEMAALVAYYLSELAPQADRVTAIGSAEITRYFKQAGYPLPTVPRQTLHNAKAAGYFDAAPEGGYKLNPVGYNLVAHALPADGAQAKKKSGRGRAKATGGRRPRKK